MLLQYHQETAAEFHGQQDVWVEAEELSNTSNPVPYVPEYGMYRLPEEDARSQAILDQMKVDEAKHADMAEKAGARDLPPPIRRAMTFTANIMKSLAYRI